MHNISIPKATGNNDLIKEKKIENELPFLCIVIQQQVCFRHNLQLIRKLFLHTLGEQLQSAHLTLIQ
jgi:hypothetical protein